MGSLVISLPGTVPLALGPLAANGGEMIAPWLLVSTPGQTITVQETNDVQTIPVQLTALGEGQVLVGYLGQNADVARKFFPDTQVNAVPLSMAEFSTSPLVAWEALDMLIWDDSNPAAADNDELFARLLAGGTAVAIKSPRRPSSIFNWLPLDGYWIASARLAGPRGAVSLAAYGPTTGWQASWPLDLRRRTFAYLVAFSIVVIIVSLWRWRGAIYASLLVSLIAAFGMWSGLKARPMFASSYASIQVERDGWRQSDVWTYFKGLRPGTIRVQTSGLFKPIFPARSRPEQSDPYRSLRLELGQYGQPRAYLWDAMPDVTLAFLERWIDTKPQPVDVKKSVISPMRTVARDLYVQEGLIVAGQVDRDEPNAWGEIILQERSGPR